MLSATKTNWHDLAEKSISQNGISRQDALSVIEAPDSELLALLAAVYKVRRYFKGNKVRIHILMNAKSGLCPEDCAFCSQSSTSKNPVKRYGIESKEEIIKAAYEAKKARAWKFCIVTSTRGPSDHEMNVICDAVKEIKEKVNIRICTSLGLLTDEQAHRLKDAGVDRFNHNLETSERLFPEICTTHSYQDRIDTVRKVQSAGMESCCGCIVGMGESDEDVVDLAFEFKKLNVTSIPVNFLNPRPGTQLDKYNSLTPQKCLKVLAMFRFVNPDKDIRVAGGREVNLRDLQPLALYAVNSIFTNGYLTTEGRTAEQDHKMIEDIGFEIEEEATS